MDATTIAKLILPHDIMDYFDIIKLEETKTQITIYLEEKNNLNDADYESKGFYDRVEVNDFPVRGKGLLLNLHRRRWIHKQTGVYLNRDFHLVAEGTRITSEFASFLKELH